MIEFARIVTISDQTKTLTLKSGRDKSVRAHHPRLFSGAVKSIDGGPSDGDVVDVQDNKGEWLARGVLNRLSPIVVRLLTWRRDEVVDEAFWRARVAAAIARRNVDPLLAETDARRLVFGESDGLPGVIADEYAGQIVVEFSALCALRVRDIIVSALQESTGAARVLERIDEERLRSELGNNMRLVRAQQRESASGPASVQIREGGLRFLVDLSSGQKTGFYLDQRDNRRRVAAYCRGARVLNSFSFSGAFSVYALAAGAQHVTNVDSSQDALALARTNAELNGVSEVTHVVADALEDLRHRRTAGELFDVVVLDPPKYAHTPSQLERATRAYKDLNRAALALVRPGGVLATFSCSGVVDAALFQQSIAVAALEAHRNVRIVERLSQASDHPVLLSYPESEYLKGVVARVE
ncbi:MAG: class I SAM-dependent rRNA methyltransferase [Chloroflexi bacterium]|nr:class I SAM-dependent rRNA methyltransferase [Chloroflexota bacterium]